MTKPRKPEQTGPHVTQYRLKQFGQKQCGACREIKPLSEFTLRNKERKYYKHWCRMCESAHFKNYYEEHADEIRRHARDYYKVWKPTRFQEVLDNLGSTCVCCGEAEPIFLTVDHIQNDGWKERVRADGTKKPSSRSGRALWSKIRLEGYPKDKYRVLCFNCNCGRDKTPDKKCPHERLDPMRLVSTCG